MSEELTREEIERRLALRRLKQLEHQDRVNAMIAEDTPAAMAWAAAVVVVVGAVVTFLSIFGAMR